MINNVTIPHLLKLCSCTEVMPDIEMDDPGGV